MKRVLFSHRRNHGRARRFGRGQSFVEFAITLPILLLIIAGLLETANVLIHYNRLQLAVREGARFGAAGSAEGGVRRVVSESLANSINLEPDHLQVWVVRPVVAIDATTHAWSWQGASASKPWGEPEKCIYPYARDLPSAPDPDDTTPVCPSSSSGVSAAAVLDDLDNVTTGGASNIEDLRNERLVVVVGYYEVPSVLNLPFWKGATGTPGRIPVRAYTIIRQELEQDTVVQQGAGCTAYPLAFHTGLTSTRGHILNPAESRADFMAREGDVFESISEGADPGFYWLRWRADNTVADADATRDSMYVPGNARSTSRGYIHPNNSSDAEMHLGDLALISSVDGSIQNPLVNTSDSHIPAKRALRVLVYTNTQVVGGRNTVRIAGFAIVRIRAFTLNGGADTISIEFVRWDNSCGIPAT